MRQCRILLTVFDRLTIMNRLPGEAKIETGIVIQDIREKLKLTQGDVERVELKTVFADVETFREKISELKDLPAGLIDTIVDLAVENFPSKGENLQLNPAKDEAIAFDLTELEVPLIKADLERLNKSGKLPTQSNWIALFRKFQKAELLVEEHAAN